MENKKLDEFVWNASDIIRGDSGGFSDENYLSLIFTMLIMKKAVLKDSKIKETYFTELRSDVNLPKSFLDHFNKIKDLVPAAVYYPLANRLSTSGITKNVLNDLITMFHLIEFSADELVDLAKRFLLFGASSPRRSEYSSTKGLNDIFSMMAKTVSGGNFYDPCFGVSSFIDQHLKENFTISGHEIHTKTEELANAFLFLLDKYPSKLSNSDCLLAPIEDPSFKLKSMDLVLSDPPFGLRPRPELIATLEKDILGRFSEGICRSDLSLNILEHVSASLKESGKGFVALSLGPLSRSGVEERIRKRLLSDGKIEAVILLPSGMIVGSPIQVAILCLSNKETNKKAVKFIAAESLVLEGNRNGRHLGTNDLERIKKAYESTDEVESFSMMVKLNEIFDNNCNLNPSRYLTRSFEFEHVDLDALEEELLSEKSKADASLMKINEMMKKI